MVFERVPGEVVDVGRPPEPAAVEQEEAAEDVSADEKRAGHRILDARGAA